MSAPFCTKVGPCDAQARIAELHAEVVSAREQRDKIARQSVDEYMELLRLRAEVVQLREAGQRALVQQAELKKLTGVAIDYVNQINALKEAVNDLQRWKTEALWVLALWKDVEDYVRRHPDTPLGCLVPKRALEMLRERDKLEHVVKVGW